MAHYFKAKTDFLYWYSLCLAMLAIGLFAFFVQKSVGSPVGWLGRSANYFGGIFALGAILGALRGARGKGAQLEQSIADLFRAQDTGYRYGFLAVAPIPIFLILMVILVSLDIRTVFEPARSIRCIKYILPFHFAFNGCLFCDQRFSRKRILYHAHARRRNSGAGIRQFVIRLDNDFGRRRT